MVEEKKAVKKTAASTAEVKPTVRKRAAATVENVAKVVAEKPKKPAAKKVAEKPAATDKPVVKKVATKRVAKSATAKASAQPTAQERYFMVQTAAYFIAEKSGFQGSTTQHWAAAEIEIAKKLGG